MTRDEWNDCENAYTLMRAIGDAHVRGTITRRRLVQVTLRCVEPIAYLLSDESLTALADLTAWSHGADDVDLSDVRRRLWFEQRDAAYTAAYAAATAARPAAAARATDAARAAARADDAAALAAAATDAAAAAARAAFGGAALCDVIRDAIAYEEIQ